jgi:hypothetical protein
MSERASSFHPEEKSELFDCLERKISSLRNFLVLTESLRDRLCAQDLPEVEKLLDQRQGLIQTIDGLNGRIHEIRSESGVEEGPFPEVEKEKLLVILNHIEEIFEKARKLDRQCVDLMSLWRNDVRDQFSKMRDSLRAVHRYVGRSIREPRFLDVVR